MSLDQIRNISFSNITDAFNGAVETVKQQSTPVQAAVAAAAAVVLLGVVVGIGLVVKKLLNWNVKPVDLDAAKIALAKEANTEAQAMKKEVIAAAEIAKKHFDVSTAHATKTAPEGQSLPAFEEKLKREHTALLETVLAPVQSAVEKAVSDISSLVATLDEEVSNLSKAEAELAKTDITEKARAAETIKANKAASIILNKKAEISQVKDALAATRSEIEAEINEAAALEKKIADESKDLKKPLNFVAKVGLPGVVAGVGAAILAGATLPFAIPAVVTAWALPVVGGTLVAAGTGLVAKAGYDQYNLPATAQPKKVEEATATAK